MNLTKNQQIPLTITGVTGEGNGVGRYKLPGDDSAGIAVFVPYTAIGDEIVCRIQKVDRRFAFGRAVEIVTSSNDRCQAGERACPAFGQCGGCVWRQVTYEAECRYKWQKVADALAHIGGLSITPEPIIGAQNPDRYRNKAQLPVTETEKGMAVGYYAARSHRVIPHKDCPLQPTFFSTIVAIVTDWMQKNGISAYNETTHSGLIRHIYIRFAEKTGEVMVCLVSTSGKLSCMDQLTTALSAEIPGFVTLVVNINRRDTNVILGDTEYTVYGPGSIIDELCGLRFKLSPRSFYQVNHDQTERLYALAAKELDLNGEETLLDLYCGVGTIGLSMARRVKTLIGVEVVAPAIEDARENAKMNGIENARFICSDAAKAAELLRKEKVQPDAVIVDPPRRGCAEELLDTIATMSPKKVVYVSCDPATLARDLKRFAERGYDTLRVTPVDLFPGTEHVETVVLLSRKDVYERIKFDVNVEDLQGRASSTATYSEIKAYILEKYGLKVSSLYIAQIKDKCGFEKRDNYNIGEGKSKELICPPEKEQAIMDAFRHFGMLRD